MKSKKTLALLGLLAILLVACGDAERDLASTGYTELGEEQQKAVEKFFTLHPEGHNTEKKDSLILCKACDLNNDGILDVVVLYTPAQGTQPVPDHVGKAMCVLVSTEKGYVKTNSLPGPHERQSIQFRDIDEKPPMEFVVSGYKGAKTGLGVYRVYGETVENLFGESMEDCC